MSSTFEQNWPRVLDGLTINEQLEAQQSRVQEGLSIIKDSLILPDDDRWDIAYASLLQGSGDGAVYAEGDPGTGKTRFGDVVFGPGYRIDIDSADRAASIEGYVNPINRNEWIPGKANFDSEEDDYRIFLNEIPHVGDNTGTLHKFWDGDGFVLAGRAIDTSDAVFYSTGNYPNGRRNKELDDAFRDRQGIYVLAGDNNREVIASILGRDEVSRGRAHETGLLPPPVLRRFIREAMIDSAPGAPESGVYMRNVIERINQSGLVSPNISASGRIGKGWRHAVRANRLIDGKANLGSVITDEELMRVAPLAIGALAIVGNLGSAVMEERLGYIDRPSAHAKAIFKMRLIGAAAFSVFHEMHPTLTGDGKKIADMANELNLHAHLQRYSYANAPDDISTQMSRVLHTGIVKRENLTKEPTNEPKTTRITSRRRAR